MSAAAAPSPMMSYHLKNSLVVGSTVGATIGAASVFMDNGGFVVPAIQGTITSGLVQYFAGNQYGSLGTSIITGGLFSLTCKGFQKFCNESCLKYGVVMAATSFIALEVVGPKLVQPAEAKIESWGYSL